MTMVKRQLGQLVADFEIYPRGNPDPNHVAKMRDSYRTGWKPPPMLIDQDNRLIDGWHRHQMLLLEHPVDYVVRVEQRSFETKGERIEVAARLIERGKSFTGKDFARVIDLLDREGYTTERIAVVIGHSPAFVEKRRLRIRVTEQDETVVTRNPDLYRRRQDPPPVKLTMAQVTADRHDIGVGTARQCRMLADRLRADNVRRDETTTAAVEELQAAVGEWLAVAV